MTIARDNPSRFRAIIEAYRVQCFLAAWDAYFTHRYGNDYVHHFSHICEPEYVAELPPDDLP